MAVLRVLGYMATWNGRGFFCGDAVDSVRDEPGTRELGLLIVTVTRDLHLLHRNLSMTHGLWSTKPLLSTELMEKWRQTARQGRNSSGAENWTVRTLQRGLRPLEHFRCSRAKHSRCRRPCHQCIPHFLRFGVSFSRSFR